MVTLKTEANPQLYNQYNYTTKQIDYEKYKAQKFSDYDCTHFKNLEDESNQLSLRELQGTFLRSKIQWHEEGEKSTKFFFNLEKSRKKKKVMKQLLTDQSLIITDQHEIMKEQVKFYTNLYQAGETDNESRNQILCELRRFLSPMDVEACEANISLDELKAALLAMEPNKSPGLDGLTAEFYKVFWRDFIDIFTRLIETSFHDNELCESMKISILTLIPKKGDLRSLNNWRPISLLNVDYKVIAKALAKRITSISKNIISEDQTCCIPGRDISENVLTMQNVIEYVNSYNKPGFILKIDQYKAFDRVDHNYLFEVAEKLGFGPKLLKWIKLFYTNIEGRIKHNMVIYPIPSLSKGEFGRAAHSQPCSMFSVPNRFLKL